MNHKINSLWVPNVTDDEKFSSLTAMLRFYLFYVLVSALELFVLIHAEWQP